MIGRVDRLETRKAIEHWKAQGLDFSTLLYKPDVPASVGVYCTEKQDHGLRAALDNDLIRKCEPALERGEKVELKVTIRNINRTVGTMLGSRLTRKWGGAGLPDDTITLKCRAREGRASPLSYRAALPSRSRETPTTTSGRDCPEASSAFFRRRRRRLCRRRTSSSATSPATAQRG